MVEYPIRLASNYEAMHNMRAMMETMKTNQSYRGEEGLKQRMAARAKRTTWRQLKGVPLMVHEMNHAGNKPFLIGLGITTSLMLYAYFQGRASEQAKLDSKYYQRFHAKHSTEDHSH